MLSKPRGVLGYLFFFVAYLNFYMILRFKWWKKQYKQKSSKLKNLGDPNNIVVILSKSIPRKKNYKLLFIIISLASCNEILYSFSKCGIALNLNKNNHYSMFFTFEINYKLKKLLIKKLLK